MGLLSNRIERKEIKAGDHIYTYRAVFAYSHHGIYVGGNKVVHFTHFRPDGETSWNINTFSEPYDEMTKIPLSCSKYPDCGFRQPKSGVVLSCLDCFLRDGALYSFEYGVNPTVFLAKVRGGTCTTATSDDADAVVHRAMYLLQSGFGNYDVFQNNCEDFALYCKTGTDYPRFFVLETIARVPYFAFISVLHMYESFGWWRKSDYLKVHFAESWNEMHHLLIMEELGGNAWWFDRFLAQHIAIFYYFMTVFMYAFSPRMAYHLSECVEAHAFETYDKFIKQKGDELKKLAPSKVAVKYYTEEDLYLFDEFQTSRLPNTRRPIIQNMYDVFVNIRDDEAEHCKTMKACQTHGNLRSPHASEDDDLLPPDAECEGIVDCIKKSITNPPNRS